MYLFLHLVLRTLAWAATPLVALVVVTHPRLRGGARERLGFVLPEVEPGAVWIHAASLGEGRVASALIPAIRESLGSVAVLRTYTSTNARDQEVGADQSAYAPVDVPLAVSAFLDRVRPRCLVLAEAELWPVLLEGCRDRGIPVAVVNARLGAGLRRWKAVPWLWEGLTRDVAWVAPDLATARELGGIAVGDLKLEATFGKPKLRFTRPYVIGGSTHPGEERALMAAVNEITPRPQLVLAPRDPARFDDVWKLVQAMSGAAERRTRLGDDDEDPDLVRPEIDVLLLDTIGELGTLYASAAAAFVGGTFREAIGGHSPAEAVAAGCPVVYGPYTGANPGAWEGVAGFVARTPAAVTSALQAALQAPRRVPKSARAAEATVRALEVAWDGSTPAERPLRPWLWPLVPAWALGAALREALGARSRVPGGRVISVGSLTAGGAGKTPAAAWIAGVVSGAVVSRGFGRDPGADVRTTGEAQELGDELAMLARRGVRVVSSPDRVRGVTEVFARAGKASRAVAVLDDALQVTSIAKDLEVVVVDSRYPGEDGLIPVGSRRLPLRALRRADVVWLTHAGSAESRLPPSMRPHVAPGAVMVRARYRPVGWLHGGRRYPLDALPDRPVAAFTGVARPGGFFRLLRDLGHAPERTWVFPDHHRYSADELAAFEALRDSHTLVTTEKDGARLPFDWPAWALVLDWEFLSGEDELRARLASVTGGA